MTRQRPDTLSRAARPPPPLRAPARPCALLAASAVFAALIHFAFAHLLLRLDPKREPVFAMQP